MLRLFALFLAFLAIIPSAYSGKAVLAGGTVNTRNADIYQPFIDQASPGGREPYIGVITSGVSLEIAQSTANVIISQLRHIWGVKNVEWLPYHPDNGTTCSSTAWNSKLNSMTGIYFNGGNTQPMLDCFAPNGGSTPALSIIRSRYRSGNLAIFGSSAGALIMQGNPFLRIQDSWNALVRGPNYIRSGGFNIFTHGFLDAHFTARGKHGAFTRLIYDLKQHGSIGFGIDQNTAIVMNDENSFRVAGTGGVYIIDVGAATRGSDYASNNGRWAIKNVRVFYLTAGDRYYFRSRNIYYASGKRRNEGNYVWAKYSADIFSREMFTLLTKGFFNANRATRTYGYTSELNPRYRVDFFKRSNSYSMVGNVNGVSKMSYANMYMDIYCMTNC